MKLIPGDIANFVQENELIRPCPRCGEPNYIDGCLDCGYRINGDYNLENQVLG